MKRLFKKSIATFLAVVMILLASPLSGFVGLDIDFGFLNFTQKASALSSLGKCGDNVTYTFDSSTGLLTISGTGEMYNYYWDAASPFHYNSSIKSVVIKSGVISIGNRAFYYCTGLTSISIPDSVISIGYEAFSGCTSLTSITIPDSVTSIDNYAFDGCTGLTSVTIGNSVTSIGWGAFYNTGYYNNPANWENDVLYINNHLIKAKETLSGAYTIKEGTKTIGYRAFSYSYYDHYGNNYYSSCSLTSISIPDSVISIGYEAFSGCTSLTSITIPDSVTSIGDCAFYYCTGLTSITIPDSITLIGNYAFNNTGYYNNSSNWENDVLYINNHLIEAKSTLSGAYTIKAGTKTIAGYAFSSCDELTTVTIPDSVTSIGGSAFSGCTGLTSITIGSGIESIGSWAFSGYTSLKTVNYNPVDCQIGGSIFNYAKIEAFNIGSGVKTIPSKILSGCEVVNDIFIPESVETIHDDIFANIQVKLYFKGTGKINIIKNNSVYNYKATVYCKQNSYIHSYLDMNGAPYFLYNDYNDDVFAVSNNVLSEYTGSSDNLFVNFVNKIGYGAFEGNQNIKSVELSACVTGIYNAAFKSCNNLQTIIIPKNVSSIGDDAFDGCDNLEIWCYAGSYAEAYAKSKNIPIKYIKLQIDKDELELNANESVVLNASFNTQLNDDCKLIWSSDNPSAVKVNDNGKVTAIAKGKAVITATTSTGLHASCVVSVNGAESLPKVNSVTLGDITLNYKKSVTLNPQITADDGASYTVSYSSSNPKVASVDENGNVKANKKGTAQITVTVTDEHGNTVTDTCNVKVNYNFGQWLLIILLFGWIWY